MSGTAHPKWTNPPAQLNVTCQKTLICLRKELAKMTNLAIQGASDSGLEEKEAKEQQDQPIKRNTVQ